MNENTEGGGGGGARRISCKASRGISTHFSGDVWSSYGVGPGLLQQNQLTQDSDNELQITVTFIMKAIQKSQVLRRIHSGVTGRMLLTILSRCRTRRKIYAVDRVAYQILASAD